MIRLSIFFALICFSDVLHAQTMVVPDAALSSNELDIRGPVKEMVQYTYLVQPDGQDFVSKGWKTIFEFNRNGYLTSEYRYRPDGGLMIKYLYDYAKKDSVIISLLDEKDELGDKTILIYDNEGRRLKAYHYDAPFNIAVFTTIFKYDVKGNEIEFDLLGSEGQLLESDTIEYNDSGRKVAIQMGPAFNRRVAYYYEKSGNLHEERTIKKTDLSVIENIKYSKYDKYGNWLIELAIDHPPGKTSAVINTKFKKADNRRKEDGFKHGQITKREIRYFD